VFGGLEVERAGSTGTVGSAEFGVSPSVMKGVPLGVMFGDGFFGNDFVIPGVDALKGGGAAEEVRRGGDVVMVVVGVPGGRGGCG
jgi:hypothetical protein